MELTPQQADELLDRIREDTGQAADPAALDDLLALEDALEAAALALELSQLELDQACGLLYDAQQARDEAAAHVYTDGADFARIRSRLIAQRRALGVLRTATGYITFAQAKQARDIAAAAADAAGL